MNSSTRHRTGANALSRWASGRVNPSYISINICGLTQIGIYRLTYNPRYIHMSLSLSIYLSTCISVYLQLHFFLLPHRRERRLAVYLSLYIYIPISMYT